MAKACASSDSHAWRSITKVKKKAESNMIWKIQQGEQFLVGQLDGERSFS